MSIGIPLRLNALGFMIGPTMGSFGIALDRHALTLYGGIVCASAAILLPLTCWFDPYLRDLFSRPSGTRYPRWLLKTFVGTVCVLAMGFVGLTMSFLFGPRLLSVVSTFTMAACMLAIIVILDIASAVGVKMRT